MTHDDERERLLKNVPMYDSRSLERFRSMREQAVSFMQNQKDAVSLIRGDEIMTASETLLELIDGCLKLREIVNALKESAVSKKRKSDLEALAKELASRCPG